MLYRNLTLMENGVKPIWVFDGEAAGNGSEQEEGGKADREMNEQVKEVLKVIGIPAVQAKAQAEAQCALFNKKGMAFGVNSEVLDSLAYGASMLLRHFKNEKKPTVQIESKTMLKELAITQNQFIDLCILCGSNCTQPIKGLGPARALNYIREYGTLEEVLEVLRKPSKSKNDSKYPVPKDYPHKEAIDAFANPEVIDISSLQVLFVIIGRLNGKR
eukprot:TRINITY_DN12879_c0_g2_i1.p1 TRINITY_DN12879_c0_g2~~TRINITY_DN12879_c0_g2_i1.p1  ORF type:complete len:216 (-),score=32.80 TRINITY_DN12879_c0_g2_i1:230-877(-)